MNKTILTFILLGSLALGNIGIATHTNWMITMGGLIFISFLCYAMYPLFTKILSALAS